MIAGLAGSTVFLWAGDAVSFDEVVLEEATPVEEGGERNFCDAYRNIGKLYSNDDNPFIQSFTLVNRIHASYGYVSGETASGVDFDYDTTEVRRFRPGAKAKVFRYFELKGQAEIYPDRHPVGGDRGFEFRHMWDLFAKFDVKKAFGVDGLDALKVGYGKRETHTSYEWDTSSNKLKTVERSGISNKVWLSTTEFSNPSGAWFELEKDAVRVEAGIFTTTQDDFVPGWDDGQMYWGNVWWDVSEWTGADISQLYLTGFYQDVEPGEITLASGVEWASSLSFKYGQGRWTAVVEGILGDNGDQSAGRDGGFWGFVFLPSLWLVEDKLEAVFRYQYQGSEEASGIRLNSRYVRRADTIESRAAGASSLINSGRGDEHHAYYLGLKYHLCKHNAHFLAGVEYDHLSSQGTRIYDGWTTFLGFRTYF
ncbi:MAG: hypothetical protein AAGC74_13290 [Verrucomicrobiota bacterium]